MADYLPITKISEIDATTPGNDEVVSKLTDSDRQIKAFLKTFLAVSLEDTGTIKASAIADLTIGEVQTANIADGAVTNPKLGALAVTNAKIADATITGAKIAPGTLTSNLFSGVLGENSVTNLMVSKSASDDGLRAISTDTIKTGAVTVTKIPADNLTPDRLAKGSATNAAPTIVAAGTSGTYASLVGGVLTATMDGSHNLIFALAGGMGLGDLVYTKLEEKYANFSTAGAATGPTLDLWNSRGLGAAAWTKVGSGSDITVAGEYITVVTGGTYLVSFKVPFFNFTTFPSQAQAILCQFIAGTPNVYEPTCVGTSEYASVHCRSSYSGIITIAANTKFVMKAWTEKATTPPPTNVSGQSTIYSTVEFIKL